MSLPAAIGRSRRIEILMSRPRVLASQSFADDEVDGELAAGQSPSMASSRWRVCDKRVRDRRVGVGRCRDERVGERSESAIGEYATVCSRLGEVIFAMTFID